MRLNAHEPGVERIAVPDGRQGLWLRRTDASDRPGCPVMIELFAGKEGDGAGVTLAAGDVVTADLLRELFEALTALRLGCEAAWSDSVARIPDEELKQWEQAVADAAQTDTPSELVAFAQYACEALLGAIAEIRHLRDQGAALDWPVTYVPACDHCYRPCDRTPDEPHSGRVIRRGHDPQGSPATLRFCSRACSRRSLQWEVALLDSTRSPQSNQG